MIGERSCSLHERADADKEVDECHMMEHEHAHRGEDGSPAFRFKVVKGCRTALERQVREAEGECAQQEESVQPVQAHTDRCRCYVGTEVLGSSLE